MTDKVDNLVLEHLRPIRADVGAFKDDVREIKHPRREAPGRRLAAPGRLQEHLLMSGLARRCHIVTFAC